MNGAMFAAVLCSGVALWLLVGRDQGLRRARLLLADGAVVEAAGPVWKAPVWAAWRRLRREWLCLPVAVVVAVLGESVLPLIAGAVAVPLVGRRLRRAAEARVRLRRVDAVIALCGAMAGELRAGRQPGQALLAVGRDSGALSGAEAAVLAAARFGGDVPGALRLAAREPGAEGLVGVAACWRVSVDGGAGLAAGLEGLERALRAERDQRADLRAELAGARSTVVILAVLPVMGLLLGTGLGADPLRTLLHSPAGIGCLVVGGALEAAGLVWAGRIVRAGECA
ncbi:type II secretion system F family protein [Streptomyces sp. NBC_01465]|uniref:type II secretion system F family protein n=1 Tax=Streptomyces sp. NBC_01465 TaxID=2903878 RepID=UPI002E320DD3|nr:type II secretion system F family protein [Streptomyces sp. NBC_01465]